jgi:hypothetical protein
MGDVSRLDEHEAVHGECRERGKDEHWIRPEAQELAS